MGERADEMRTEGSFDDATRPSYTTDATPAQDATDSDDTDEIRDDIEQTRADMSETIDAIQEKLSPDRLTEQAKEAVRDATVGRVEQAVSSASETARDAGTSFFDTIKQNPIPAAMAAVGIGWLWMNRKNNDVHNIRHVGPTYTPTGSRSTHEYYNPSQRYSGGYGRPSGQYYGAQGGRYYGTQSTQGGQYYRGQDDSEQGGVGEMASQATERAGEMAEQAKEQVGQFAGQMQDQASQFAGQVQDQASQFADQAQYQARQAQYRLQDTFRDNPLAVAAAAFGIGAAVGLVIPETEKEDQFFGEARDTVVDRAQTMAQDTMEKVQNVMSETKDAAQQAAQDEGLTSSS